MSKLYESLQLFAITVMLCGIVVVLCTINSNLETISDKLEIIATQRQLTTFGQVLKTSTAEDSGIIYFAPGEYKDDTPVIVISERL